MMATLKDYRVYNIGVQIGEIATQFCKEHGSQGIECEIDVAKKSLIRYRERMGYKIVREFVEESTNKKRAYLRLDFESSALVNSNE